MHSQAHVIVQADTPLYQHLLTLARQARLVFFAGMPGTGKSLLLHQLAHLAVAQDRTVHLLQWDVARPAFEAATSGQRYPAVAGVTHGMIRKAVGMWARDAVEQWYRRYPDSEHLLIGETPFIGNRLIELVHPAPDAAECILRQPTCLFVIPVPSVDVRARIETIRQQRSQKPLHQQETEDAPPMVLQALWQEVYRIASLLGIITSTEIHESEPAFDPILYQRVYQALLTHRHCQVMMVQTALPTAKFSPYNFAMSTYHITPSAHDVTAYVRDAEQRYPTCRALQRSIDQWYHIGADRHKDAG